MAHCIISTGFLLLAASALTGTHACGITTHMDIAYRALEYFNAIGDGNVDYNALIRKHEDAFQGATSFPDTFYAGSCESGKFHQVSEDTHWTPYMEVAARYIRETYPQPWSKRAEKLVVFLLGIISHSVADISWHNLHLKDGFIEAMSQVNFHGSYGKAHSHADFGGDVVNQVNVDTDHMSKLFDWHIPAEDLANIYKLYYGDDRMSKSTINWCTKLMYLGRFGEDLGAINLMYPSKAMDSPFLLDRLQDYFLGGMDDMAAWTTHIWRHTVRMIHHGSSGCDLNRNPIKMSCPGSNEFGLLPSTALDTTGELRHPPIGYHHPDTLNLTMGDLTPDDLKVTEIDGGIHIQASDKLQERLFNAKAGQQIAGVPHLDMQRETPETDAFFGLFGNSHKPVATYKPDSSYARLGESLLNVDLNGDGFEDLVIGAPVFSVPGDYMAGRAYVIYGTSAGLPKGKLDVGSMAGVTTLPALQHNSRFGQALAAVDFNADGIMDLAISAPSVASDKLKYNGAVYVYFGKKGQSIATEPDVTISCTLERCNFGWSLAGHDANADGFTDLIIGSPFASLYGKQRGLVNVFYSRKDRASKRTFNQNSADWKMNGDQDSAWFGFDVSGGASWLAVGAPQYRKCINSDCFYLTDKDIQAAGKVYMYKLPLSTDSHFDLPGWMKFAQFGNTVAVSPDGNLLAVAAISENQGSLLGKNQEGRVYLYDMRSGNKPEKVALNLPGDSMLSRFGGRILIDDVNKDGIYDLIISAPMKGAALTQLHGGAQEGRVHIYYGKDNAKAAYGIKSKKASSSDELVKLGEGRSRFGTAVALVKGGPKLSLVVSSVHSNSKARLGGKVTVHEF